MSVPAELSAWEAPRADSDALALDRPGVARIHDYLLGGKDNYAADRDLARRILRILPRAAEAARDGRAFLGRAVRTLAERGVRQFVDLGCGLPAAENLHRIAARHTAAPRVLYVDGDPLVIAHARALLLDGGNIGALRADLREPEAIASSPEMKRLIDPAEPTALVFSSVLHFLPDPHRTVAALAASAAPGSALVISHATADGAPAAVAEAARLYGETCGVPLFPRGAAEIEALFGPFTPLAPGVTPVAHWRFRTAPRPAARTLLHGGVGVLGAA
ncbi:SAM-dependent methyltransferase [Actinomadura fibrosa]|uniref:SAM-dependent methyltransferase n=1 Tax=Actinomadura fibrosa TaxID=111802 RepID=A0ABW2XSA6_9ACTN